MPASALKILGLGRQSAFATSTAPSAKFMGLTECAFNVDEKPEVPKVLGQLGAGPLGALGAISANGSLEAVASPEMLRYMWNGLFAIQTGTSSGSVFRYDWTAPVGTTQAHEMYTMEYGAASYPFKIQGGILSKVTVKGEAGSVWTMGAEFIGKQCTTSTGPTSVSDAETNLIRMADTTLYIDAHSTATIGGTAVAATLASFEFGYETGRHLKTFAGSVTPGDYGEGEHVATLKLQLEYNASAHAYIAALTGGTGATPALISRQIRLVADQGSSATQRSAQIDFAGYLSAPPKLWDDRDGNQVIQTEWVGRYSTSLTNVVATMVRCASSGVV